MYKKESETGCHVALPIFSDFCLSNNEKQDAVVWKLELSNILLITLYQQNTLRKKHQNNLILNKTKCIKTNNQLVISKQTS